MGSIRNHMTELDLMINIKTAQLIKANQAFWPELQVLLVSVLGWIYINLVAIIYFVLKISFLNQ